MLPQSLQRLSLVVLVSLAPLLAECRADDARRTQVVRVFERVKDAVVNIHSERTIQAPEIGDPWSLSSSPQRVNGMGTGIVIDPRGYILTNHHVVEDVSLLRVRLADGTTHSARVAARDPSEDIAILKIDVEKPLPIIPMGTSGDLIQGEPVIAIGNAYGYEHTLSTGIISALNRDVTLNKEISYKALIQTNATINPGNSGGPLLNIYGELIGVNVAIRAGAQGIAFAIPADTVVRVATELLSSRRRTGVWHGLVVRNAVDTSRNPVQRSLVVLRCEANSPAQQCGLQPGDVLLQVAGVSQETSIDLERALIGKKLGDEIPITVRRSGQNRSLTMDLKPIDRVSNGGDLIWRKMGMRVQTLNAEAVTRINSELHGGLRITDVRDNSPASGGGLQRDDILIGIHQWEMVSPENLSFIITHPERPSFEPLRFFILRAGQVHQGWLGRIE